MLNNLGFQKLNYQEKKQTLIELFSQLQDTDTSFEDTIFLLTASDKIQEQTLDQIYLELSNLLQHSKTLSQSKYLERLKNIEIKIQQDAQIEGEQADLLLDNI